ncbi:uncharacterized protein EV154DRAFT_599248 [Mucor mucedo]|uniref:uncharacterized protein n=1 Tax=Mucor mucedo TaxID=29922 RepID=UPI00222050A6|nr:uncharacterized protein EV154DRAFT_599248 [Mucor mucedo]KAI7895328.1 hypothetical protein EV154DRAFT_599248 [Mucor mucedo]
MLKTLKADILLADVLLIDYSDFDKVISQYSKQQDLDDDQGEVFKAIITAFKTISAKHRNISIRKYVGNVKDYYCSHKDQFLSLYTHKFQLLEKDKENQRDADIVAAEEVSRGISRSRKRLAEQQPNMNQPQEKTLKTSTPSPLSSSVSSSSCRSTVPSSLSMSRFLDPDTDTAININEIRSNLKEEAKTLHDIFARGTNIHNNIILVKGGECTYPYTQFMKSILYSNQDKVIGHKIDLRLVANSSDGNDIDVGAFEAANALPSHH